ncbi:hypothetical protein M1L60_24900 [Actinoplanes sp. TRM 88003]|uniref:Uncharacterized protein n=1 Tax=Paractinoplanes aksuensis TaxID=2939490 RepID=A0ABT1DSP9_9ACTN|nr:hypothetical protein [Actinoplanes aksuensis]MCO8273840.1 hypothetical protein [Actinoplanes aksuensis]
MTSLDELKSTLEQRAGLAPDPSGLVEQARAGAVRLRRRNRIRAVAAAVVAVGLVVGVPSVVRSFASEPPPNPAGPMTYYREPSQLTLELAPDDIHFTMLHGTLGKTQFLLARGLKNGGGGAGGTVAAHDPGTFDPTRLRRGEPVTVQGRPGFYVDRLDPPAPASSGPDGGPGAAWRVGAAVGWQDPSGVWVTVYEANSRASILRLAEAVRLTSPRTARTPLHFGWVPRDLPVSYVSSRDVAEYGVEAHVGFGGPAQLPGPQSDPFFDLPYETPLTITALSMEGIMTAWGEDYAQRPMRPINGHKTWYAEGQAGPMNVGDGSVMMIDAGSCAITVVVKDRQAIPEADVVRMVENMTIGTCEDITDWTPVVGP